MKIDGINVEIQPSTFANAMALKKALADALRKDGIDFDLESVKLDEGDLMKTEIGSSTVGSLIENGLAVATDTRLREVLFQCCDKVVLFGPDRLAVDEEFFAEVERWPYYYPIMFEVVKVNVIPFFGQLSSMFSGATGLMGKLLKQK